MWGVGIVLRELCGVTDPIDDIVLEQNDSPLANSVVAKDMLVKHPVPEFYSSELRGVIDAMLHPDYRKRPSLSEILAHDWVSAEVNARRA